MNNKMDDYNNDVFSRLLKKVGKKGKDKVLLSLKNDYKQL